MFQRTSTLVLTLLAVFSPLGAQTTIDLNAVIGSPNTNAATVAGVGNAVNHTGYALGAGATDLLAPGSTGSSSFDFNTGFADTLDRAIGSTAGAGNVFADRKYDSSGTGPLLLDTDNDGAFLDGSPLPGIGMHGDTFITFDLVVIRSNHALAAGTPFTLTGLAGVADFTGHFKTSAAIILDGSQLAVFDWTESGPINQVSSYNLNVAGAARYLTFVGLSGLDANNWGAHIGFANVQLQAVPEPSVAWLLGAGVIGLGWRRLRGRPGRN